jgi:eukaryotic-like serine/threonine-protein kinase
MANNAPNTADRDEQVDEAIAAYLEAAEAGRPPDREAFLASHPEFSAELRAFFADHDQFQRIAEPLCLSVGIRSTQAEILAGAQTIPALPTSPDEHPLRDFGDYELLSEIARGGMGVVYKARQKSLNRSVALKMILAGRLASAADVQRFRGEAELAAKLDHPAIVPVYEVGEHEGHPFFSMKLLEGGSLAAHRQRWLHDPSIPARLVAQVARAVHHAHQRGMLHRDLKPANVLLDAGGQPYVTDFGLAKLLESDAALTPSGGVVGTPRYMAPEQAAGKQPSTAVDVYGIGGILYELLTGRPPFTAETPLETMLQVLEKEPERPRTINPRVHADLETICLKCLEKDPERRYGSAQAVAEELDRFLAGEPILARQIGPAARLWRWCRRKPVVASLSAALLLVFVGSFIAVTALWQQAVASNIEKEAQREVAETQRKAAEKNLQEAQRQTERAEEGFRRAHQLVNQFCIDLSEKHLASVPGTQMLRLQLMETAMGYYREFVKEHPDDGILRAELGSTLARSAGIVAVTGSKTKAIEMYQEAVVLLEKVRAEKPEKLHMVNLRADLGRVYNRMGILLADTGRPADESYRQAKTLFEELVREFPTKQEYQTDLAAVLGNLGLQFQNQGKLDEALAIQQHDLAIKEKLAAKHPNDAKLQHGIAITYGNIASLQKSRGQREAAADANATARKILEKLIADHPQVADYQVSLAMQYRALGSDQRAAGELASAQASLQLSLDLLEKLVRDNPKLLPYQNDLAAAYRQIGQVHLAQNQLAPALDFAQKARNLGEKLVKVDPNVFDYQNDLAKSWFEMGLVLYRNKQHADSVKCYQQASDIRAKLVEGQPNAPELRNNHAAALVNLGQSQWLLGRREEGSATVRRAIAERREACKQAPKAESYRSQLGGTYRVLAELESKSGRLPEAAQAYVEFRQLWPNNAARQYEAARELALIASLVGKGKTQMSESETSEREKYAVMAIESLRDAIRCGFKNAGQLEQDGYFATLRDRKDFTDVLADLRRK